MSKMNSIRAVIFDLDETLLDRTRTIHNLLLSQFVPFQLDRFFPNPEAYARAYQSLDNNGYTGRETVYQTLFQGQDVDIMEIIADAIERLASFAQFRDGARETLSFLRENQYRLGMITNGDGGGQLRKIKSLGIESYFDTITISGVLGIKKPDPEIFQYCLAEMDVKPSEAVFVGDHPENDIQGSRDAGLTPIWIQSAYYEPPEDAITIQSLKELPNLLGL